MITKIQVNRLPYIINASVTSKKTGPISTSDGIASGDQNRTSVIA